MSSSPINFSHKARYTVMFALLLIVFAGVNEKAAAESFLPAANYPCGTNPRAITLGDFNGDGTPDLAVGNQNSDGNNINVLLGVGNGTFQSSIGSTVAANPISLTAADFNGDGKLDLASANDNSSNVSVLLGNGNGTFQSAVNYTFTDLRPTSITVGDFNNDSKIDIAVLTAARLAGQASNVSMLLGNGNGTFQFGGNYVVGGNPWWLTVGDFNGDGKPDIATANAGSVSDPSNNVSVLISNGDGTFQPVVNYYAGSFPNYIVTADLNRDGKLDLVVANFGSNDISVLLGNGNGTFRDAVNYFADTNPSSIAVGDFNVDGKIDVATANAGTSASGGKNVSVLFGKGDGAFESKTVYFAGSNPTALVAGDFNRDGKPDLAVANLSSNNVSVLLNSVSSPTPLNTITGRVTDINGNSISFVTITVSNSGTGQSGATQTDANGYYSLNVSTAADTVAASKAGYTFDPPSARCVSSRGSCGSFTQNFIGAARSYTVNGKVIDGNGNGIGNVLLQLASTNNVITRSTVTDASGAYSFTNLPEGGSYVITPAKDGYAFNLSRLTITNLSANRTLFPLTGTTRPYTISGTVKDANGNALADTEITLSRAGGSQIIVVATGASGTYSFTNVAGEGTYTVTPAKAGFSFDPQSQTFSNTTGNQTANFTARATSSTNPNLPDVQFAAPQFDYAESDNFATIIVSRVGDTSGTTSVDYLTTDGTAQQRTDYTIASGTLTFAPGETTQAFTVLITNDAYPEPNETVTITLSNATSANLGARSTATLVIHDNDFGTPTSNPIDDARFFVRQQYLDFLNRQPDAGGWDYWTNLINGTPGNNPAPCAANDAACLDNRRISVSAAFFIEQEFQDTGSFVYRFYKGTLGRQPLYSEFVPDRSRIVGGANLEASKRAFADAWTQRAEFLQKYPQSLSAGVFVDALLTTVKDTSGVDLSSQRQSYVDQLQSGGSRAQIIRSVSDAVAFRQAEYNRAFVLMQYFGYLKRDPDSDGYRFWLDILSNRVPNNYRSMVCAFITSAEYQDRFSSVRTRNDARCSAAQ